MWQGRVVRAGFYSTNKGSLYRHTCTYAYYCFLLFLCIQELCVSTQIQHQGLSWLKNVQITPIVLVTCLSSSSHRVALTLSAAWMVWICMETAESTASSRRLNSSKHPQAPHLTRPMNILPMDLTSMPSSQLNTRTCKSI